MHDNEKSVYDYCTTLQREIMSDYCCNINQSSFDVMVVMAQKAVQLIQVLLDQNLILEGKDTIIVSNEALLYDTSYIVGKKVAVVDDIVISGSSISSVIQKLLQLGVKRDDIEVIVLATNTDYLATTFTDSHGRNILRCNYSLDDASCITLSYAISHMLASFAVPYVADFPIYSYKGNVADILDTVFGDVYDITNEVQNKNNIREYIFFPNKSVEESINRNLGIQTEGLLRFNIRLYQRTYGNGSCDFDCVPTALLCETKLSEVEEVFGYFIERALEIKEDVQNEIIAKARFIEFIAADAFMQTMTLLYAGKNAGKPYENTLLHLFGPQTAEVVGTYMEAQAYGKEHATLRHPEFQHSVLEPRRMPDKEEEEIAALIKNIQNDMAADSASCLAKGYYANSMMLTPFKWWYENREIPARQYFHKNAFDAVDDADKIEKGLPRLLSGFSVRALERMFENTTISEPCRLSYLITLFVDRCIDEGIIVPILFVDDESETVCHAYRHGEDLPFAEADEVRLVYFLEKLFDVLAIKGLSHEMPTITLEKLIVLFYQISMNEGNIFNRFLGFNNIPLISKKFAPHGAVEAYVDRGDIEKRGIEEHIYSETIENSNEQYITWLTKWAERNSILVRNSTEKEGDNKYYEINSKSVLDKFYQNTSGSCISDEIKVPISEIAEMLADLFSFETAKGEKDQFKADVTVLTSCADLFDYASAMATAIHYFNKYWKTQGIKGLDEMEMGPVSEGVFTYNSTAEALASGVVKHEWFENRKMNETVDRLNEKLVFSSKYSAYWNRYWASRRNSRKSTALENKARIAVEWLYFYDVCYEWLSSGYFESGMKKPEKEPKVTNKYLAKSRCYYEGRLISPYLEEGGDFDYGVDDDILAMFDEIKMISDEKERIQLLKKNIHISLGRSEALVKNIEDIVLNRNVPGFIEYDSCLILSIRPFEDVNLLDYVMAWWNSVKEGELKTRLNIYKMDDVDGVQNFAFLYRQGKGEALTSETYPLVEAYRYMTKTLANHCYKNAAVFVPKLPATCIVRHNMQKDISEQVNRLKEKLLNPVMNTASRVFPNQTSNASRELLLLLLKEDVGQFEAYFKETEAGAEYCNGGNCDYPLTKLHIHRFQYSFTDEENETEEKNELITFFSTLRIVDKKGKCYGTGFLYRTRKNIFCVTCRHVVNDLMKATERRTEAETSGCAADNEMFEGEIYGILGNGCRVRFSLLLLNPGESGNTAADEVAVLKPEWDYPSVNPLVIFSRETVEKIRRGMNNIRCYGFPGAFPLWDTELKFKGRIEGNYVTLWGAEEARRGLSGAPVVSENDMLLGMHKGHAKNIRNVIPSQEILKVIEMVENCKIER